MGVKCYQKKKKKKEEIHLFRPLEHCAANLGWGFCTSLSGQGTVSPQGKINGAKGSCV